MKKPNIAARQNSSTVNTSTEELSKTEQPRLRDALAILLRPGASSEWNAAIHAAIKIAETFDARITAALAELHRTGKYTGGWEPFGFALGNDGKTLIAVDDEQHAIARARELKANFPKMSLRAIAQLLEEAGLLSRRSKDQKPRIFKPTQIKRMLDNDPDTRKPKQSSR